MSRNPDRSLGGALLRGLTEFESGGLICAVMSDTPGTWAAGASQHRNLSIYKVIEQVILPEVEEKFRSKNTPYCSKIQKATILMPRCPLECRNQWASRNHGSYNKLRWRRRNFANRLSNKILARQARSQVIRPQIWAPVCTWIWAPV